MPQLIRHLTNNGYRLITVYLVHKHIRTKANHNLIDWSIDWCIISCGWFKICRWILIIPLMYDSNGTSPCKCMWFWKFNLWWNNFFSGRFYQNVTWLMTKTFKGGYIYPSIIFANFWSCPRLLDSESPTIAMRAFMHSMNAYQNPRFHALTLAIGGLVI